MIRILSAAIILLVIATLWFRGSAAVADARADKAVADLGDAKDALGYLQRSLAPERASAKKMATIGDKHEEDRTNAQTVPAAVATGLDDGSIVLRKQWAACETRRLSDSVASAIERDALAELRKKDQGDLVRVGRDADDQVKACQAVAQADRQKANP